MPKNELPDWESVLSSAARLQRLIPDAVLVGGTAAAMYAKHRFSRDADHVLQNLPERFDAILHDLESVAGWETARIKRPVLILGSLDGIETGIRQLIRKRPLETTTVEIGSEKITVPTEAEILRIKGVLILKRNAVRDYLDFAALAYHLGNELTEKALIDFDSYYPQINDESALIQLQVQLAEPLPFDLDGIELNEYKNLKAPWNDWTNIRKTCSDIALIILDSLC